MPNDFSTEYSKRSDDELLHLASQRHSLTPEAKIALDTELRRRNLTESDRLEHHRFVKRQEQLETRKHRRRTFGPFKYQLSWLDIFWGFAAIALISVTYIALPSRYHMNPDWGEAAFLVMMTSVFIAIASRRLFWRNSAFWISLAISSAIHLAVIHQWTQRVPSLNRGGARLATLLGFGFFIAVYALVRLLRRMFYSEEVETTHEREASNRIRFDPRCNNRRESVTGLGKFLHPLQTPWLIPKSPFRKPLPLAPQRDNEM